MMGKPDMAMMTKLSMTLLTRLVLTTWRFSKVLSSMTLSRTPIPPFR